MQNAAVPIQRGQPSEIESKEAQTFSLVGYGHALPVYNNDAVCKNFISSLPSQSCYSFNN